MKRLLIAAATAAALATGALAGAAPAAAEAPIVQAGGHWNGPGHWNGGKDRWDGGKGHWNKGKGHGAPRWHARKACEPIIRWRMTGYGWHKKWVPVVVGWDCHRGRGHRW